MTDQLVRTFFNLILGWTRGIMAWFWQVFDPKSEADIQGWFQQNWIKLVICICVVCAITDLIVYLLRWRPLRVWTTFFRRVFSGEKYDPDETADTDVIRADEISAGHKETQTGYDVHIEREYHEQTECTVSTIRYVSASNQYVSNGSAVREQHAADTAENFNIPMRQFDFGCVPDSTVFSEENDRKERLAAIRQSRKRFQWSEILNNEDPQDNEMTYRRPQPVIDKSHAYRAPVYPEQWKGKKEENQ